MAGYGHRFSQKVLLKTPFERAGSYMRLGCSPFVWSELRLQEWWWWNVAPADRRDSLKRDSFFPFSVQELEVTKWATKYLGTSTSPSCMSLGSTTFNRSLLTDQIFRLKFPPQLLGIVGFRKQVHTFVSALLSLSYQSSCSL